MPYKSPFESALLQPQAVLGLLGDVSVILRYGSENKAKDAARARGILVDLPWLSMVEVRGRDRVRFLHGMCTNDIKKLQPGQGCMAAVINRQGKMVASMTVRATEESLLLEVDRSSAQATIDALSRFLVADDVKFRILDWAGLGVYGSKTREILEPGDLPEFHFIWRDSALLTANRITGFEGYDLWVDPARADTLGKILSWGFFPAGFETYEGLRIENGFPRWGADMDSSLLPMEAGLEPLAISYSKGCYIGQEVIQRVKTYSEPPKMLVQLEVQGASPGDKITAGGEEVGAVTSAAPSLALGILRKEWKSPGTEVSIAGRQARVRELPWHSRQA